MKPLGQRIKEARKAGGYSQAELGGLIGVSGAAISGYENGKRRVTVAALELLQLHIKLDALEGRYLFTQPLDVWVPFVTRGGGVIDFVEKNGFMEVTIQERPEINLPNNQRLT